MKKVDWKIKHFNDLTAEELFDIYYLRTSIFVVEQDCPYQEVDFKDKKAYHVMGYCDEKLIAISRLLPKNTSYIDASIGRVAIIKSFRGSGVADSLMEQSVKFAQENLTNGAIRISAQEHLQKFYNRHGFHAEGEVYLEDDIPHVEMVLSC
jgi:ElaA protein